MPNQNVSQSSAILFRSLNRMVFSLDGTWDFVVDLDPKYHNDPLIYPRPEYALSGSNRRHWSKVSVPGVWQKYAERYEIFEGVGWFSREFEVSELPKRASSFLRFGAVNYCCRVFLNGTEIGSHEGGYTEFTVDCTDALRVGRNLLIVQVDNRATTIKWPPVLGYFNYGGIHRSVTLVVCSGASLTDLKLTAVAVADGGELTVSGRVEQFEPGLIVCINSENMSWEDRISVDGYFEIHVPFLGIELWSPDQPNLISVNVALLNPARQLLDSQSYQCGFRSLTVNEGQVFLNNNPLTLKGICYVYDSPQFGLLATPEQINTDLQLMKEAGCNAVRCHYPMDPIFYDACDRLGLLVWIEPPVYCYHPGDSETGTHFTDPAWLGLAQQMAREMVAVARNHPSVAIYSIGNECNTANPEAENFFRRLAETIRAEDPTRLISYAALYGIVRSLAEIVDILGINSYWGWYDKIGLEEKNDLAKGPKKDSIGQVEGIDLTAMREMLDTVLRGKQGLTLLLTEFGADSVPGFYAHSRELWSENYHANLLRAILNLAKGYPQIAGTFPFCFSDYRDPSKIQNGYWDEYNLKGLVSYGRRPKLAFKALQEAYI